MKVNYQRILGLKQELLDLNKFPLAEIQWVNDAGYAVNVPPEVLEEYKFTGLNHCDLPKHYPALFEASPTPQPGWMSPEEVAKLKFAARWLLITLGFYGTEYNYQQKIGYPDGSVKTGIEKDMGHDARVAAEKIKGWGLYDIIMAARNPDPEVFK